MCSRSKDPWSSHAGGSGSCRQGHMNNSISFGNSLLFYNTTFNCIWRKSNPNTVNNVYHKHYGNVEGRHTRKPISRFAENLWRDEKKNVKYLFTRRQRVGRRTGGNRCPTSSSRGRYPGLDWSNHFRCSSEDKPLVNWVVSRQLIILKRQPPRDRKDCKKR